MGKQQHLRRAMMAMAKVNHEIINNATGDYLIHSSVLGTVLTKLKVNGAKDITYVPTNGLVAPMQMQDQPYSNPATYLRWVLRDPLGIQEDNMYAIDPFGTLVPNAQPPSGGPPSYIPMYGATYNGVTGSLFVNGNNFSGGCLLDGHPADCNKVKNLFNDGFVQLENGGLRWTETGPRNYPPSVFDYRSGDRLFSMFVTGPRIEEPNPQDTIPSDLKARVEDIGHNCQEFLNRFFNALGSKVSSPDLGKLFDRIKTIELSQKPFDKHDVPSEANGLAIGDGGNRQIYIKPVPSVDFEHYLANEHYQEFRWNAIAKTVVQELLHHARISGTFQDSNLDRAALKVMNPADQAEARAKMKSKDYFPGMVGHGLVGSNCNVTNPYGPPPRN